MFLFQLIFFLVFLGSTAFAQGTSISISPTPRDNSLPVEVTADNLTVEQTTNSAVFTGNAKVVQGALVLSANSIMVRYNNEQSAIDLVEATTNVIFSNGAEMAEARRGIYRVASGRIDLTGDVLLVQGSNAISGDALTLDLNTSTGAMTGNVKSVFIPKENQ
ncbi:MAG: LptA/OstA family protein [Rhodobacteraceae bacterium]|nr:LptA/OstA family protein [Paracoccaceae bacterium]